MCVVPADPQVFQLTGQKKAAVAGCRVLSGQLIRKDQFRVWRGDTVVHEGTAPWCDGQLIAGRLSALKQLKEDMAGVSQGKECGLSMDAFDDYEVGDMIECFQTREVPADLDGD